MVDSGDCRVSSRSSRGRSEKFSLALQRLDGRRPCHGLDQHENYSRCSLLCSRNSHWSVEAMAGKGSHGSRIKT